MLEKDRAEPGLGFLRSSEPELQPGDPLPYLGVGGILGGDSFEESERFDRSS